MENKLNTLGLAYRANKLILGEEVFNEMQKIKLIIIASDISQLSKQRLVKKCNYYSINYIDCYTSKQLSNALGKNMIKTIGVIDDGFAKLLDK